MTENHGVPGSNPGPATYIFRRFAVNLSFRCEVPAMNRSLLLQPYCHQLGEQFVYLLRGFILHVGQQMRVGIKGDDYVGMSACLLNHLGVGADREHQGGTGVTQVVEADVGKPCTSAADSRICRKLTR